ncbi:MAG TPA: YitT family protein [Ignavibacteriales bacterium]|nr:YitT family protein [Ignavibacteriales bacterium]HOL81590.1 YitT family protein [Ignavibacteriales bacterium]HPP33704.1 YitT family protein [Ignavibacteriales bacterium]
MINRPVVFDYLMLTIGTILMSLGIAVFLLDARVVPGGASGLSMAIHYLSNQKLPVGVVSWLINLPLFLWGIKELGNRFAFRTFYCFTMVSIFIDLFRGQLPFIKTPNLAQYPEILFFKNSDFFFYVLVGSVLLGIGLGIIFKFKGTTAGSDIIASILSKRFGMKPGQVLLVIDLIVIAFAGYVIKIKGLAVDRPAIVLTFYAVMLIFVYSRLIDAIMDGIDYARLVIIISENKLEEIRELLLYKINRGGTLINAEGLYKKTPKELIMTVVSTKQLTDLTDSVKKIDPEAFIIITEAYEILGKGFRRRL